MYVVMAASSLLLECWLYEEGDLLLNYLLLRVFQFEKNEPRGFVYLRCAKRTRVRLLNKQQPSLLQFKFSSLFADTNGKKQEWMAVRPQSTKQATLFKSLELKEKELLENMCRGRYRGCK
jgi:hypothetical protein